MIYEIYDIVLMISRRDMMILINIYVLYDDSNEGFYSGFTGFHSCFTVWLRSYEAPMDVPMERLHMGLIYEMCSRRGWCDWSFNHDGLGRSGDVTVLLRGLPRPTLVSGSIYDISWFYDI